MLKRLVLIPNTTVTPKDDVLLLDAPGFPDPKNAQHTIAAFHSYIFAREDNRFTEHAELVLLPALGKDVSNVTQLLTERLRIFPLAPLTLKSVEVDFCKGIIVSHDGGFGILSDIDDTIKLTNTSDEKEFLLITPSGRTTNPYRACRRSTPPHSQQLSTRHNSSTHLNDGPDVPLLPHGLRLPFMTSSGASDYKMGVMDSVCGMYPNEKFLAIGDSAQQDPETHAEA
ncbi:hypothetical protein AMATHDRAFT_3572 [Amanita thiersii Skay4041]|uniref:Uncharacterized protein n=1 Tax=Amanita thiersii Skay4041 TaxID=703135 RepID=A0A2A9NIL2_9AGAR|nr:hypothetical protein AMATHDRAFT_3572 [Amanita thiersii Skay4041]